MQKKVVLIIAGLIVLLGISALITFKITKPSTTPPQTKIDNSIILYYSTTCPHCIKVEQFMTDNKIEEKLSVVKKEVYNDKNNAAELGEKAHACGLNTSSIGVPFLWDGPDAKCIVGDEDIIKFFQEKIK
jgi:glutaredoxin